MTFATSLKQQSLTSTQKPFDFFLALHFRCALASPSGRAINGSLPGEKSQLNLFGRDQAKGLPTRGANFSEYFFDSLDIYFRMEKIDESSKQ